MTVGNDMKNKALINNKALIEVILATLNKLIGEKFKPNLQRYNYS